MVNPNDLEKNLLAGEQGDNGGIGSDGNVNKRGSLNTPSPNVQSGGSNRSWSYDVSRRLSRSQLSDVYIDQTKQEVLSSYEKRKGKLLEEEARLEKRADSALSYLAVPVQVLATFFSVLASVMVMNVKDFTPYTWVAALLWMLFYELTIVFAGLLSYSKYQRISTLAIGLKERFNQFLVRAHELRAEVMHLDNIRKTAERAVTVPQASDQSVVEREVAREFRVLDISDGEPYFGSGIKDMTIAYRLEVLCEVTELCVFMDNYKKTSIFTAVFGFVVPPLVGFICYALFYAHTFPTPSPCPCPFPPPIWM